MAKITKQSEWLACEEPQYLGYFLNRKCDQQRFRWLAVDWLPRIRHLIEPDSVVWFDAYSAWVRGQAEHPKQLDLPPLYYALDRPNANVSWARSCLDCIHDDHPMLAAAFAGASASEDFPRLEYPPRVLETLDYSKQHKGKSAKRKQAEQTQQDVINSEWAIKRTAWELTKKKHQRKVGKEFCDQFRCVAGNPFREVVMLPEWRSTIAVALAKGIDESSAYDRMPMLADALEEAGCDSVDILKHCREPGPHARGCGVVDMLLGRV